MQHFYSEKDVESKKQVWAMHPQAFDVIEVANGWLAFDSQQDFTAWESNLY